MEIKHLGGGIVLIEDLLDQDTMRTIDLSLIESQCTPQGYKKIDGKDYMEGGYSVPEREKDLTSMPIRYIQDIDKLDFYQTIDDAIYRGAVEYCKLFPVAAESITNCVGKHFIKYLPGGLMGPHSDASLAYKDGTIEPVSAIALGNTVTVSIILNNEFKGGNIKFRVWDIEVSPKPGSALFYPSNYIGAHEVLEVTSGKRWAFLAFLSHGDRSFTTNPELEKYSERYEWTMKLRQDVRDGLKVREENINVLQRAVPINVL
jgi:hypothetical protein